MTAGTAIPAGPCCKRVADRKIAAMDIDHIVTERTHFIGKPGLVTIKAETLLVA